MPFCSIFCLTVLCQISQAYVAPVFFIWAMITGQILNQELNIIAQFFILCILLTYQQFQSIQEDRLDGFFDHVLDNGTPLISYVMAKTSAQILLSVVPIYLLSLIFQNYFIYALIATELIIIIYFSAALSCLDQKIASLQLLFIGLPLLTAPTIFLFSFYNQPANSTLLLFLGSLLILSSIIGFMLFLIPRQKNYN